MGILCLQQVTWWTREREIDREVIDRNLRVVGHGPRSDLIVTPLDLQYYGMYTCKAVNPHGEAFHQVHPLPHLFGF